LQKRSLDEVSVDYLDKIIAEARRTSKIVTGLLEFARKRPLERRPLQIEDILDSVLELMTYELTANNIKVSRNSKDPLPLTIADPYQLQSVFVNIISNACQAMHEINHPGHLSVTTRLVPAPGSSEHEPASRIQIRIQDNGPGIAEDALPQIFDPFFTTKPVGEGTGLGLSICYGIIKEHDGHIWAKSQPGGGATFIIELPVVKPKEKPPSSPELPPTPESVHKERILIIDDERVLLEALSDSLQQVGFQVDCADRARSGLEYLKHNDYSMILCDIRMPGMSGIDFYQQVLMSYPDLIKRLVFTTGDSVSLDTQRFLENSGAPCITKPFEIEVLLSALQEWLTN
jgi:two-component system NtrC family sensor kinase